MKRLLLLVLPAVLLLASCQLYDNTIHATTVTAGSFVPTYDSSGKATGTHQQLDTSYTVSPSWSQAWKWAGQRNNRVWFWLGVVLLVIPIIIFIVVTSNGNDNRAWLALPIFAITVGGALIGTSLQWERWNMDQTISKPKYDSLMQSPGNLGPFWDNVRIK